MTANTDSTQFITVRIGTLRGDESVGFDIYIRVGERYLHYIRKSDPFDQSRIDSLKTKKVQKLFIPAECETAYLEYLDAGLGKIQDSNASVATKATIAQTTMVNLAENAERAIGSETGFKAMEKQSAKVSEFLAKESEAAKKVLQDSGFAHDDFQHASNVNTLCMMLAGRAGIKDPEERKNLSMAALLHDIGKQGLTLPQVAREKLDIEALKVYKSHCAAAVEKLSNKPYVNPTILTLIMNHEEVGEGAGFPDKKRIQSLPLVQQVLNLCNEYDRVCTVNKTPPLEAMKQFYLEKLGLFPLPLIEALRETLKL
jgi:HD-GYP domain-containing protein (c-di-GMP phosphodiesterase class II)